MMMTALRYFPPPLSLSMKLLKDPPCQLLTQTLIHSRKRPFAASCSVKLSTMALFCEPHKIKLHLNYVREKVWDVMPNQVKEFPWKNAEAIALIRLMVMGQEALKWSLPALFVFSFVSDVLYSISQNKELVVPFSLFVGCMITNFLKETLLELFPHSEERGHSWHIFGMGCFFLLVKLVSVYFSGGQVFLLNAANGGLMQIFWLWKSLQQELYGEKGERIKDSVMEDTSTVVNAQD
ncbi:hypothetical protein LguiB_019859 [Lonicera macranthoides]